MRFAQVRALQAGLDHRIQRDAFDHGFGDSRRHGACAGYGWAGKVRWHTYGNRVRDRARDIVRVQQSYGRDAHRRAVGIAPGAGRARIMAGFERVDAAPRAGTDIRRVVATDTVVPTDQSADDRIERHAAGVNHRLRDGKCLFGIVGDAAGGQAGVNDMIIGRVTPAIEPAEAALCIVWVDLRRHGEGIAQRLAIETSEDLVESRFHYASRWLSLIK